MKCTKLTAVLLLTIVGFTGACRKNKTTNSSAPVSNITTAPSPGVSGLPIATPTPPAVRAAYFNGSIGESNGLQMKLLRDGDKLTGTYCYQRIGTEITIRGTVDQGGNLTLDEFDPTGKQTGTFKGIWKNDLQTGLGDIAGNWSKPNGDKKTAFSIHQQAIDFTSGADVIAKQIRETNKKSNYKIEVGYPEIKAALDTRFDKFNQEAKNVVTSMVAAFKKEQAGLAQEDVASTPTGDLTSTLNGSYTITLANDNFISVLFSLGGYTAGAAHDSANSSVLNYDLKAGKALKLTDLFKPGAKYLAAISTYCVSDLQKQSKQNGGSLPDDMIKEGTKPTAENFRSWTIARTGLQITFDEYQVGPYAAGPQKVLVPYSSLKDLIKPDGPIGGFAK